MPEHPSSLVNIHERRLAGTVPILSGHELYFWIMDTIANQQKCVKRFRFRFLHRYLRFLLAHLDDPAILYTYREQNQVADLLAKSCSQMNSTAGITVYTQPPYFVRTTLEDDRTCKFFVRRVALPMLPPSNCLQTPLVRSLCTTTNIGPTKSSFSPDTPFCYDLSRGGPLRPKNRLPTTAFTTTLLS
ncbi:uncharacterized protein LOC142167842 isoform X1 [Nicotiana tabacum]|uniref:Uncharacterized protein LOC142167842 isoform X1 n=1 Tax=Nicotiana tabacum TaxID=4097 RepID=A0AC58SGK9_TOBAC